MNAPIDSAPTLSPDPLSGFYLTLISMMQSLAFGFLVQTVFDHWLKTETLTLVMLGQAFVAFLSIVLVWHEYAIGTISFSWELGIIDSLIPFSFGIVQYAMIALIVAPKGRYVLWLWSTAAFACVAGFAYWNQSRAKQARDRRLLLVPRRNMKACFIYAGLLIVMAVGLAVLGCPAEKQVLPTSVACALFLFGFIQIRRSYPSLTRERERVT